MIHRVRNELSNLRIKDTHRLYEQNDRNRKDMHGIDQRAKELSSEVYMIGKKIQAFEDDLRKTHESLIRLEAREQAKRDGINPEKKQD